jgi:CCR4-NOT transcription complex subunit 7/8
MDTEFPGVVVRPLGTFKSSAEYHYQTLRSNVNILKLIQLGLTFSNEEGLLPRISAKRKRSTGKRQDRAMALTTDEDEDDDDNAGDGKAEDQYCVWQFNFKEFNLREDVYAHDSIELLKESGINFIKNEERGIEYERFAELLMSSGIVMNENMHWITFHSGYDFGYLLKILTSQSLPSSGPDFFNLLKVYFPTIYDIKYLMKFCNNLHGGLNRLAEMLEVERFGACHQAGSDSLLTSCAFRKLKEGFFNGATEKYAGVLYGLGMDSSSGESYS